MKKILSIFAAIIVALVLFYIVPPIHHINELNKFASMIRAGDNAGVSQLLAKQPNLIEADLDTDRHEKLMPLAMAAGLGQITICSNLIAAGASVNSQDIVGETPLHLALMSGNTNVVPMLLQHGADITIKTRDGWTPLFNAVFNEDTNMILLLLQRGADPVLKDRFGDSLLDLAKKSKVNDDVIKILSEAISRTTNQVILK